MVLPSPGSPCRMVSFPKGIYGYHSQSTSRSCTSDIRRISGSSCIIMFFLSFLLFSFSLGTVIYIPPFIKICFAAHGSVLQEKVHSPFLRSAVFPCTSDSVPTLLLTVYHIGVCDLLAASSFESAWVCTFPLRHDPTDRCPRKVRRISCRQGIRLCLRGYPLILLWETILRLS